MQIQLDELIKLFEINKVFVKKIETYPIFPYLEVSYHNIFDEEKVFEVNLIGSKDIEKAYNSDGKFALFQIAYTFPFHPKKAANNEVQLALAHLNQTSLIPGFSYLPNTEKIIYRAAIPLFAHLSSHILLALVKTIAEQIEAFEPAIRAIAKGEISYEKLTQQSRQKTFSDFKKMLPFII